MTAPKISVLLPVYNGEKHLAEAIDSILAQTFTNFELIVINDGSTDSTLAILQAYQVLDNRIRLISRENKGLVATLNEGIDLARGEWLARMDQDDIALPNRFERQLQHLKQTGAELCGSGIKFFGTPDRRIFKYPQSDNAIKVALLFASAFAHPTVMMKTALIKQLYYDSAWENAEDYDLWVRAARAGWLMTNIPEPLLHYRQHGSQMSNCASEKQRKHTQKIRQRHWEFLTASMNIRPEWIDEVIKIREPFFSHCDMDAVDSVFITLLLQYRGEARVVLFDHITRLYIHVAAHCPNVVRRWSQLNKIFDNNFAFGIKVKLWLLNVLQVDANSQLFNQLKKLYFYCVSFYQTH